jgi:mono/diheme cytochrome c family protein
MAHKIFLAGLIVGASALVARSVVSETPAPASAAAAIDTAVVQRGRYIIRTSGCNDCHTPGFMQLGEKIPESQWLTGMPIGWRGPWGTTYASNLRLFIKPFSADEFVKVAHTRNARPPMPWPSLRAMSDEDLKAVYCYIKSLGEAGTAMPEYVPPDKEPATPYLSMEPQMPAAKVAAATTQPIEATR